MCNLCTTTLKTVPLRTEYNQTPSYYYRQRFNTGRRAKAGVILYSTKHRALLLVQTYYRCWGFAKGSVERYESIEDAAIRELYEETGIQITPALLYSSRRIRHFNCNYYIVDVTRITNDPELLPNHIPNQTFDNDATATVWIEIQCLSTQISNNTIQVNAHLRKLLPMLLRYITSLVNAESA